MRACQTNVWHSRARKKEKQHEKRKVGNLRGDDIQLTCEG